MTSSNSSNSINSINSINGMNSAISPAVRTKVAQLRQRNPFDPMPISQAYHAATVGLRTPQLPAALAFLADLEASPGSVVCAHVGGAHGPQIVARVVLDEDSSNGDDYVTGRFTDERSEYTVPNTERDWSTDYTYYEPSGLMVKEKTIDTYRARGMSAASARLAREREIQIDMRFDAQIIYLGVEVAIKVNGLSVMGDSLWGIGVHSSEGDAYIIESAAELTSGIIRRFVDKGGDQIAKAAQHVVDLVNAQAALKPFTQ